MYHPFKKLETAWNARTPDYLHPRTKANFIWQLKLTAMLLVVFWAKESYELYRERKKREQWKKEQPAES